MRKRIIEYLMVEIKPFINGFDSKQKELRVRVQVNGELCQYTRVPLPEDDIVSLFDTLFEYARRELKTRILSTTDPSSSTQEKHVESSSEKSGETDSH